LIVSQETNRGEIWRAEVTPSDGTGDGPTAQSNNITILNVGPIANATSGNITNPLNNSNQSGVGANFTFVNWTAFFDVEGDTITYSVTLRDLDNSLNSTIDASTTNLFASINYTLENNGSFILMVEGCDTFGDCDNNTIFVNINTTVPEVVVAVEPEEEEEAAAEEGDGTPAEPAEPEVTVTEPIEPVITEFCYVIDSGCSDWSACVGGESSRTCTETFECIGDLEEPPRDSQETVSCSCDVNLVCGEYSECNYVENVENVITGEVTLTGDRERTCVDTNGCTADTTEFQSCSSQFSIDVDVIGDILTGTSSSGVPVVKINLSELAEGRLSIVFVQNETVSPAHCYNAIQDADEMLVDCGGECKRCIVQFVIPWLLILLIILILILLWLIFAYSRDEDEKKKLKKKIMSLPIVEKIREDASATKKEREKFGDRLRKLFGLKKRKAPAVPVAAAPVVVPVAKRERRRVGRSFAGFVGDLIRAPFELFAGGRIRRLIREGHREVDAGNLDKAMKNYAKIRSVYSGAHVKVRRKVRGAIVSYYKSIKKEIGWANKKINERNSREISSRVRDYLKKFKRFGS